MSEPLRPRSLVAALAACGIFGAIQVIAHPLPDLLAAAAILSGVLVALTIRRRERFARFAVAILRDTQQEPPRRANIAAPWLGFLFVAAVIAFLEWRDPFYFTQDDNFSMGPIVIAAGRSLMSGIFPTWNPYQLLGAPTSLQSIYGLTYPVTYAVFAVVHWLGKDHAQTDSFIVLHLVAGYWAMYWAARAVRVRPLLAVTAAISFIGSGTVLVMSRSYATMSPLVFWAPLLIVAAERFRRSPGVRWAVATAVVIGVFCHSGNGQMWLYAVMFFGIAVLIYGFGGGEPRRSMLALAVAACFSLAISLLLIVPQMWFMKSVVRFGGGGLGIFLALPAVVLPMPLVHAAHPAFWGDAEYMTTFYYGGTILTLCTIVALVIGAGVALSCRGVKTIVVDNVWPLCAGVALWMAAGPSSNLWTAMSHVPVLDKFAGPWKLLIYFHLFAAIAGAIVIERMLAAYGTARRIEAVILIAAAFLIFYNATNARSAFYNYGEKPYPALPPQLTALLQGDPVTMRGRVLPVAPARSQRPGFVMSMALDFPTYYGIASFDGYDPFVHDSHENRFAQKKLDRDTLAAARAYGVRWVLFHDSGIEKHTRGVFLNPFEDVDFVLKEEAKRLRPSLRLRLVLPRMQVYELPGTDPMAFPRGEPAKPLPVVFDQAGATVDVGSLFGGGAVVVNVLNRPGMRATVDGVTAAVADDEWRRTVVNVRAGARRLRLAYEPPWRLAWLASAAALLAGLAGVALLRWSARRAIDARIASNDG